MKKNKILFAISSLGLGHATRILVIIKYYLKKGYQIDIISSNNALKYLKQELIGNKITFFDLEDYPALERGEKFMFYIYLILDLIKTIKLIKKENIFIKKIEKNYDFIISDGKYGIYSKIIPSFLISHQLSFIIPKGLEIFQKLLDIQNIKYFKNFNLILIPDYKPIKNSLAGKLSHPKWINEINYSYIGILSDFCNEEKKIFSEEKIDYLFTITGYLQEHKQNFINYLIFEAKKLNGRKVFILGDSSKKYKKNLENNIEIYSYVVGEEKKKFFNNANVIISRAGYTTIMDLVELGKKAILFPTPNQTEQEYLALYLKEKKYFLIGNKNDTLIKLDQKLNNIQKNIFSKKTKESLKNIDFIIQKYV